MCTSAQSADDPLLTSALLVWRNSHAHAIKYNDKRAYKCIKQPTDVCVELMFIEHTEPLSLLELLWELFIHNYM